MLTEPKLIPEALHRLPPRVKVRSLSFGVRTLHRLLALPKTVLVELRQSRCADPSRIPAFDRPAECLERLSNALRAAGPRERSVSHAALSPSQSFLERCFRWNWNPIAEARLHVIECVDQYVGIAQGRELPSRPAQLFEVLAR